MLPKIKKLVFEVEFQQSESPYQGRSGDAFLAKFNELRQTLLGNLQEFMPVEVVPRPPPPHLVLASGKLNRHAYLDTKKNKLVQFPRKNSFEVYVDNFQLFSRLESGAWPDVNGICEWALRVAEKLVDLEIEKEELPLKGQTSRDAVADATANERLPPVGKAFDQTAKNRPEKSHLSNYPRSRYSSLREDDALMPYGVDPMNATATQRRTYLGRPARFKGKAKSIEREFKTISRDLYTGSRDQSFHWHLKQKPIKPLLAGRYPEALLNTFEGVAKIQNLQLSPLPAVHQKNILDQTQEVVSQVKAESVELCLSESPLNIFCKYYRTQANKVIKTSGDEIWSPILCQTPLPLIGEYSFQVFVHSSAQNQVQLGIAPLNYYPRTDQVQRDSLISFNCGNGQIKDAKHNSIATETQWREGGIKVTQKPPFCLKVAVNTKAKLMEWHVDDAIAASAKLPSQYNTGFRAFLSLYHSQDAVWLNNLPVGYGVSVLDKNESQRRDRATVHAFAQTGTPVDAAVDAIKSVPVSQNRIYPNLKAREAVPMIDEITQTTQIIQGRIKKQRFHKFLQKSEPKKAEDQRNREDFTVEDVNMYKTILSSEPTHHNHGWSANSLQQQRTEPKPAIIDIVIQQQAEDKKSETFAAPIMTSAQLFREKIQVGQQKAVEQQLKEVINQQSAPSIDEAPIIEAPSINQQLVIHNHDGPTGNNPSLNTQQQLLTHTRQAHPSPTEQAHPAQLTDAEKQWPGVVGEQQEVSEAGEAMRWEGVYEQGTFKLRPHP